MQPQLCSEYTEQTSMTIATLTIEITLQKSYNNQSILYGNYRKTTLYYAILGRKHE